MVGASFVALLSLSAVSISAAAAATSDELIQYGMSLAEFDDVRMSESEADFDGSEELWDEALLFEYKLATSYTEDKAITSLGYQPYMICNYAPDKTGIQRAQMVNEAFQNTSGVDVSHFFFEGISELNNAERSCGVIRTFNDTIPKVYASNPDAETWMKTNPIHPSMKMVDSTVTTIQARMDGDTDLGMISIDQNENGYIRRSTIEFSNVLCPGVRSFNGTQIVSGKEISQAAQDFVVEDGGKTVRDASYYYDKVNNGGNNDYTERMKLWSDAVSFVVNLTDPVDGRNPCLDIVVGKIFTFEVSPFIGQGGTGVLEVYSSVSEEEGYVIAEASNMTKDDVDQCIWYTLYAIALNPMVCSVEPKARPQTLCPDLTSDLSQCPPPSPAPSQPSSGRVVKVSLMNKVVVSMAIAVSSFRILN